MKKNLYIEDDIVTDIITRNGKLTGVTCRNIGEIICHSVVICTGTFLRGRVLIGKKSIKEGRMGEESAEAHRKVGQVAAASCDLLVATGGLEAAELAGAARAAGLDPDAVHLVSDAEAASALLNTVLQPGDVVLIKGSRGVGLDRTVDALLNWEGA